MTEQWTGDWMRDAETGQFIDGPTLNRYQMFMLIRELRAVIHAHAQTIRDEQAVIDDTQKRLATSEWQTAEWITQANQLTVANNEKAGRITELAERVRDAEHLCKWLLQSDISDADRERVIRENGINFSIALCSPEPKP